MRRITLLTIVGLLALGVSACGGGQTQVQEPPVGDIEEGPAVSEDQLAEGEQPVGEDGVAVQPSFADPLIPGVEDLPSGRVPPDLISSTPADQRVRTVSRNRQDPFALVPGSPVVVSFPDPEPEPAPQFTNGANNGGIGVAPAGQLGAPPSQLPPGSFAPVPNLVPGANGNGEGPAVAAAPPPPPPPPQPTLARGVEILGVVQVGSIAHAIVRAPNEPTSRYVRVGQRLSNGEVLVKRIDMRSEDPLVVLEQFGIEVPLAVGANAPAEGETPNLLTSLSMP
ncbi:MAG: hypothetical protein KME20_18430 [Kaiparowitsia implicata GSE-PSE-MK54-09C]|jgi:hypothetical protein|nr:hypothetical protein [Kaiparowitsia implicata GSE-PSE-MK54-09C]